MSGEANKFVDANLTFCANTTDNISLADYARHASNLLTIVKKTSSSVLQAENGNQNLLEILNPAQQSIGYLHVLIARSTNLKAVMNLWDTISNFLETFDGRQIAHDLESLKKLVGLYVEAVSDKPIHTIRSLRRAILRLNSANPHVLTPIHSIFVHQCLKSQSYRAARKVIDHDIRELPKAGTDDLKVADVLQYFLYSGIIYLGLKEWEKAAYQFTVCLLPQAPQGNAVSKIQLEAYKKYILAHLLNSGTVPPTPKLLTKNAGKIIQISTRPYELFGDLYESGDSEQILRELDIVMPIFEKDGNMGLVMQCLASFRKFKIIGLKDTYATLSMNLLLSKGEKYALDKNLGRKARPLEQEMEYCILSMINEGSIHAKLSQSSDGSSIVRFDEPSSPTQETEAANLTELMAQIAETQALTDLAKATSRRMGLEKEYINQSGKAARNQGGNMYATHVGGYMKAYDQGDPMEDVFYVEEAEDIIDDDF